MKCKIQIAAAAALGVIFASGSLFAHHAFGSLFDVQRVHRLKGVVTAVAWTNPHSLVFLETKDASGQIEHWAIEGRPSDQWRSMGVDRTTLKAGDTIEVCGYGTKDGVSAFRSYTPPEPISLSLKSIPRETSTGRLIFPEVLTLQTGRKLTWGVGGSCVDTAALHKESMTSARSAAALLSQEGNSHACRCPLSFAELRADFLGKAGKLWEGFQNAHHQQLPPFDKFPWNAVVGLYVE